MCFSCELGALLLCLGSIGRVCPDADSLDDVRCSVDSKAYGAALVLAVVAVVIDLVLGAGLQTL